MKTLQCDLCSHEAQGESFEEWLGAMKPHYSQAHAEFMQEQSKKSPEEQEASMKNWMTENKARFDAA